jgi:putative phosphoesterase
LKIAVISDVHGNLEALQSALSDIDDKKIDTIVCLGDLVGYGPFPNQVVELIRSRAIINILGNYDAAVLEEKFNYIRDNEVNKFCMPWAVRELKDNNRKYLETVPRNIVFEFQNKKIRFVHGSTRKINEYLPENSKNAEEVMESLDEDILFCGHTHIPYIKKYGEKVLCNDGSVGKPKIGRPNGTYIIVDVLKDKVSSQIIEFQYDYKKTVQAMKEKHIHTSCIKNILSGIE